MSQCNLCHTGVLLLLASFSASATKRNESPVQETVHGTCPLDNGKGGSGRGSSEAEQYIVRFKSYLLAEDHHARLAVGLPGEGRSWRWVPRNNKAAKHPTDFGLIKLSQAQEDMTSTGSERSKAEMAPCMGIQGESSIPDSAASPCPGKPLWDVLSMLSGLPFVRDVHADKRFTGKVRF